MLWLAETELFRAKWTADIHIEWIRSRLDRYSDLKPSHLEVRRDRMDARFPDSLVRGYEALIESLSLPDANDRHVLAAAIKCGADTIVTSNVKDFPPETLAGIRTS